MSVCAGRVDRRFIKDANDLVSTKQREIARLRTVTKASEAYHCLVQLSVCGYKRASSHQLGNYSSVDSLTTGHL